MRWLSWLSWLISSRVKMCFQPGNPGFKSDDLVVELFILAQHFFKDGVGDAQRNDQRGKERKVHGFLAHVCRGGGAWSCSLPPPSLHHRRDHQHKARADEEAGAEVEEPGGAGGGGEEGTGGKVHILRSSLIAFLR